MHSHVLLSTMYVQVFTLDRCCEHQCTHLLHARYRMCICNRYGDIYICVHMHLLYTCCTRALYVARLHVRCTGVLTLHRCIHVTQVHSCCTVTLTFCTGAFTLHRCTPVAQVHSRCTCCPGPWGCPGHKCFPACLALLHGDSALVCLYLPVCVSGRGEWLSECVHVCGYEMTYECVQHIFQITFVLLK